MGNIVREVFGIEWEHTTQGIRTYVDHVPPTCPLYPREPLATEHDDAWADPPSYMCDGDTWWAEHNARIDREKRFPRRGAPA
jgi:hypothetical protein